MRFHTILVPVDRSTCSVLATQEAVELAAQLRASVVILSVDRLPAGVSPETVIHRDGRAVTVVGYADEAAAISLKPYLDIAGKMGVNARAVHRTGDVAGCIRDVAVEIGADVIVMSTHGRTGMSRMVLGSVAEETLKTATVPVMLIRREVRPECERESCAWCVDSVYSEVELTLRAEQDG